MRELSEKNRELLKANITVKPKSPKAFWTMS
jgi:hypothetical protein